MGTRSLTIFRDQKDGGTPIAVMYRQFDGYLDGHGLDLSEWAEGRGLINGISGGDDEVCWNGMGCLAADCIMYFKEKNGQGGIYMHPADGTLDEEYMYTLYPDPMWDPYGFNRDRAPARVFVKAECSYYGLLYDGPMEDFDPVAIDKARSAEEV